MTLCHRKMQHYGISVYTMVSKKITFTTTFFGIIIVQPQYILYYYLIVYLFICLYYPYLQSSSQAGVEQMNPNRISKVSFYWIVGKYLLKLVLFSSFPNDSVRQCPHDSNKLANRLRLFCSNLYDLFNKK